MEFNTNQQNELRLDPIQPSDWPFYRSMYDKSEFNYRPLESDFVSEDHKGICIVRYNGKRVGYVRLSPMDVSGYGDVKELPALSFIVDYSSIPEPRRLEVAKALFPLINQFIVNEGYAQSDLLVVACKIELITFLMDSGFQYFGKKSEYQNGELKEFPIYIHKAGQF